MATSLQNSFDSKALCLHPCKAVRKLPPCYSTNGFVSAPSRPTLPIAFSPGFKLRESRQCCGQRQLPPLKCGGRIGRKQLSPIGQILYSFTPKGRSLVSTEVLLVCFGINKGLVNNQSVFELSSRFSAGCLSAADSQSFGSTYCKLKWDF